MSMSKTMEQIIKWLDHLNGVIFLSLKEYYDSNDILSAEGLAATVPRSLSYKFIGDYEV